MHVSDRERWSKTALVVVPSLWCVFTFNLSGVLFFPPSCDLGENFEAENNFSKSLSTVCLFYICSLVCLSSEKAMAPHSSTFAWKIPWTEEPGRLQSMGSLESDMTERLHFHFSLSCTGEGNGNPLQCSSLENPRDGEASWAAVYGVAQRWTWLKWLSSKIQDF